MPKIAALIVAAGRSVRFGGVRPKQYLELAGEPVLRRTARSFLVHPRVDVVRIVMNPDDQASFQAATATLDIGAAIVGGESRQESVRLGLEALAPEQPDFILIHDGARPLVGAETIDRLIDAAAETGAAIAALPVSDTLKREQAGVINGTVDRTGLWRAQTPQAFRFADILEAHRKVAGLELTDDAVVMERAGWSVHLVPGEEANIKITTAQDLALAERLLAASLGDVRLGTGFDVHAFGPGDHVWIGGVQIPHSEALVGHSDADVGLHAITDAILGAIAAGDIGTHFPPSDEQWRGAASDRFLAHAAELVRERGGVISHVDLTVICERPKIGPHRPAMVARIAEILAIDPGRVSVKATTTEQLGFTGRREGIAAQAAATIRLPL